MAMRVPKLILILVAVASAGPALAGPAANVIDVTPPAEPPAVVVLRGSSAPPQPWGGPPAPQAPYAQQPPTAAYSEQAYLPLYFLPGYYQTAPQRAPRRARPAPQVPQVAPAYPIRPWGVGLAPFQR
jgi:hypothetical protein